jgi:hypothetical protein
VNEAIDLKQQHLMAHSLTMQLAYVPARFPADPFGTVCGRLSGRPLLRWKAREKILGPKYCPFLTENKDTTEIPRNLLFSTVCGNSRKNAHLQG